MLCSKWENVKVQGKSEVIFKGTDSNITKLSVIKKGSRWRKGIVLKKIKWLMVEEKLKYSLKLSYDPSSRKEH